MTKAVHQIHVNIQIGWIDLAIAWGERLLWHGINDNGLRTATLEQDIASLKQIGEIARKPKVELMPAEIARSQPFKIQIDGGLLVISMGIDALVFAAEHSEGFQPHDIKTGKFDQWKVRDADEFAKEVANQLHNEEEDGSTSILRALDEAFLLALESGCKADLVKGGAE